MIKATSQAHQLTFTNWGQDLHVVRQSAELSKVKLDTYYSHDDGPKFRIGWHQCVQVCIDSDIFHAAPMDEIISVVYISSLGALALQSVPFDLDYFQVSVFLILLGDRAPPMLKGSSSPGSAISFCVYAILDLNVQYKKLGSTPLIPQS